MKQLKSLWPYIVILGLIFIGMIILFAKIRQETAIRTKELSTQQIITVPPQPQGATLPSAPAVTVPSGADVVRQSIERVLPAETVSLPAAQPLSMPRPSGAGAPPPPVPPVVEGAPSAGPGAPQGILPPDRPPIPTLPEERKR